MKNTLTIGKAITLVATVITSSLILSDSAHAVDLGRFLGIPFIKFSTHRKTLTEPVRDPSGNVVRDNSGNVVFQDKTDIHGNPITVVEFDPPPVNEVTKIGFDISFDPSKMQILTDPSTYGFLCIFSLEGICPNSNEPAIYPVQNGSPLMGALWDFNVDNSLGRAIFAYDFSSTPVNLTTDTNFFAFQVASLIGTNLSESDIVQNSTSSQQYCKTTISDPEPFSNNCGEPAEPVPEPTTIFGSFLALSLGGWLKQKKSNPYNKTTP